ncbi:helix-turn-helix domain-containing protein [Rhizosphaericola mali]|uniref:helix-turn-helix domain-containing protein n=1 Tax=Rhizosphaericola mali TaxID=2545455 RepID=UPI001CD9AB48|nr:helix-turn-helix domain-containing protein [Rhizosphaericola mali]
MVVNENITQFYKRISYDSVETITQVKPHVNVFERKSCKNHSPFSCRDYYKVTLIRGGGVLEYADKVFHVNHPVLLFTTPKVPYNWRPNSDEQLGWFCIFNEAFAKQQDELLSKLPMFQVGTDKLYYLDESTEKQIAFFYEKMMAENAECYEHKQDLLRNYLHLIIHQVLKMQPVHSFEMQHNASERITSLFFELLERQFPIDSMDNQLQLRTAKDYAGRLSVHTNHLNRAVKKITGETTTKHIAKRIILEANDMLRHTNWPISEIAFILGFEEPSYFNNFYKKNTGIIPKDARNHKVIV